MVSATVRRRAALGVASGVVIATGLGLHAIGNPVAAAVADGLYTVLIYLVLALIFVRGRWWSLAIAAFALSAGVEVMQLTGWPEQWAHAFSPAALLFGSAFSAMDLVAYAGGALAVGLVDGLVLRSGRPGPLA